MPEQADVKTSTKLTMVFATTADSRASLTLDSPKTDLDAASVTTAMESLIDTNSFTDSKGSPLNHCKTAQISQTTVQTLF